MKSKKHWTIMVGMIILVFFISCNSSKKLNGIWENRSILYPEHFARIEFSGNNFTFTNSSGYEGKGTYLILDDNIELTYELPSEHAGSVVSLSFSRNGDILNIGDLPYTRTSNKKNEYKPVVTNPNSALIGQWETSASTAARDLLSDRTEFFKDGTGFMEARNIRGVGPWTESFSWRIASDGRLLITTPAGIAQAYTIVELTRSKLIVEGNSIPGIGFIRTAYSKK